MNGSMARIRMKLAFSVVVTVLNAAQLISKKQQFRFCFLMEVNNLTFGAHLHGVEPNSIAKKKKKIIMNCARKHTRWAIESEREKERKKGRKKTK